MSAGTVLPVREPHPVDPTVGACVMAVTSAPSRTVTPRSRQRAYIASASTRRPPLDVPGTEGLLHPRDDGQRSGRATRVRAGVGGVAPEVLAQARVTQIAAADVVEAPPRRDRAQVREPTRLLEQVTRPGERRLQEGLARHGPDVTGVDQEASPVLTGRAAERGVERSAGARPVVGHVELGAVREPIVRNGIHLDEVDALLEGGAGLEERVPPHRGQGQQRRPGVEHEAVPLVAADLAAPRRGLLADDDLVPLHRKPCRDCEPAHPGSDDDDAAHS